MFFLLRNHGVLCVSVGSFVQLTNCMKASDLLVTIKTRYKNPSCAHFKSSFCDWPVFANKSRKLCKSCFDLSVKSTTRQRQQKNYILTHILHTYIHTYMYSIIYSIHYTGWFKTQFIYKYSLANDKHILFFIYIYNLDQTNKYKK